MFDLDRDGYLSKAELVSAIEASLSVLEQNNHDQVGKCPDKTDAGNV